MREDDGFVMARNKAVVQGYLEEIVNRGDFPKLDKFFGEHIVFNGREMTRGDLSGVVRYVHSFLANVQVSIDDQIAEGDKVASRVTYRGTHTGEIEGIAPTGRRVEFRGFAMDRLSEGKVVEMWHEVDMFGLLRQLGAN